jgi:fatty acid desaturase
MSEKLISQAIKKAEVGLRRKYKILNSQDVIGAIIFLGAFIGIFTLWSFYFRFGANYQNCVMIILTISFLTSILHELEHDLIHNLYFRKNTLVQDVMFFFIWLAKLHGNPWFRREMHLKHHIVSGQTDDAEERLIGLGLPCGFERIAVSIHPFGSLIVTPSVAKDAKWLDVQKLNLTSAPVAFLFFGLNKLFIMYIIAMMVWGSDRYALYLPARHWIWIRAANVLLCLPNLLRQACLVLMSNCSHYYGDIPERSVLHQNQILDHPLFYPFQIMCANFGAPFVE